MNGKQLRLWRTRLGFKVYEAAERLGVSRATYARWEATASELPRHVALACSAIAMNLPEAEG